MGMILGFRNILLRFFSLLFFSVVPSHQSNIMGNKKPKDPETPFQSDPPDSPSKLFKFLFGETVIDANPFKRKHDELAVESEKIEKKKKTRKLEDVEDEMEENEKEEDTITPQKKEKRKYPNAAFSNANNTNSEAKKAKGRNFEVGSDSNLVMETEREGNAESGDVSNGRMNGNGQKEKSEQNVDTDKKDKKKKRKREELGTMYEVKKYGVAVEEERDDKGGDGNNDKGIGKKRKKGESPAAMMKKKRKREELGRMYEVKKYGVAVEEEKDDKGGGGNKDKGIGKKRKKGDNPAEMMKDSEGFDDESKLLRTVFVGNLPLKFKKKALIKEFSKFGEVESVRIRSVPLGDVRGEVLAFIFFMF